MYKINYFTKSNKLAMQIKKNIPLIDQHDKNFLYGGKFGGNFIPETLKKPIDDLTNLTVFSIIVRFFNPRNHLSLAFHLFRRSFIIC